ncbi:MAG: serine protease [Dehalococcoidia bacterium]|jgi:hypothetical protein
MWKKCIVSGTFVLLLLLSACAFAQYPGGYSVDIGNLPNVGQSSNYGPVEATGHLKSVVRIIGVESPGHMVKGSGVYVNYEGFYCIVTASHVVRGVSKLYVSFPFATPPKTIQGEVLSNDPTADCAIIGLYQHPENASDIVAGVAYRDGAESMKSSLLQNAGFGGDDVLNAGTGRLIRLVSPAAGLPKSWMAISSTARFGDSGGPIFLPDGKVCGILWGKDNTCIMAVYLSAVHACLQDAKSKVVVEETQVVQPRPLPKQPKKLVPVLPTEPPVLPWRDKIENEIKGIKDKMDKDKPSPPSVRPTPPVEDTPKVIEDTPKVEGDGRYRVDRHIALPIVLGLCLICVVVGVAVQWKKTYSIQ